MIVPMQKVTVLGYTAWQDEIIGTIRDLGILHIIPSKTENKGNNKDTLIGLQKEINLLEKAIGLMPHCPTADDLDHNCDIPTCAKHLLTLNERQKTLNKEIENLKEEYNGLHIWGRFSPERLKILKDSGLVYHFYLATIQDLNKIPSGTNIHQIGQRGKHLLLFTMDIDKAVETLQEITPPPRGMAAVEAVLTEKKKTLAANNLTIKALSQYRTALVRDLRKQKEKLTFMEAKGAMTIRRDISYLCGFCPTSKIQELRKTAKQHHWGIIIEEPGETEPVPTLIQYSRWTQLFKPVMDFIGVIPGYREFDCNGPSLFFFIIFFAMLIGDAGYGSLLCITALLCIYQGKMQRDPFILLLLLSMATMIWGALTGTWFGIAGLEQTALFSVFTLPSLTTSDPRSAVFVMQICFVIGAIQLIIAHLWRAVRKFPSLVALADIGWALLVGAIYFLSIFLVINRPMPPLAFGLFICGMILVILFSKQSDTFSVGAIARALAHSPLTLLSGINTLSDLISYIRLFAVGIATREVALTVNHLALNMGFETILSTMATLTILLVGHGLNMILGAMAILVHGVRLNLLEFSRHLGINWSGIHYNPFKFIKS